MAGTWCTSKHLHRICWLKASSDDRLLSRMKPHVVSTCTQESTRYWNYTLPSLPGWAIQPGVRKYVDAYP
jgi:hypothetical protein